MSKKKDKKENAVKQTMFDGQHEDEEVIYVFRRHPVVMRHGLIAVLLGILAGMIPLTIWPPLQTNITIFWPVLVGMLIGSIYLFYQWIGWFYSIFIVTNQRFIQIHQQGLFHRAINDISLEKILSVNFSIEGMEETVLGFGTIVVQTFVGDMVLRKIHHPAKVQERIIKIMKDLGIDSNGTPLQS